MLPANVFSEGRDATNVRGLVLLRWLAAAQVVVSSALVVVAAGAVSAATRLDRAPSVAHVDQLKVVALSLPEVRTALQGGQWSAFSEFAARRLGARVAVTSALPGVTPRRGTSMTLDQSRRILNSQSDATPSVIGIDGDYFHAMGVSLVEAEVGMPRPLRDDEVVVNRAFAAAWWPGQAALGRTVSLGPRDAPARRVVAVAEDVAHGAVGQRPLPEVYVSMPSGLRRVHVLVHGRASSDAAVAAVEAAVAAGRVDAIVGSADTLLSLRRNQYRGVLTTAAGTTAVAAMAVIVTFAGVAATAWMVSASLQRDTAARVAVGATPTAVILGRGRRFGPEAVAAVVAGTLAGVAVLEKYGQLVGISPLSSWGATTAACAVAVALLVIVLLPHLVDVRRPWRDQLAR